MLPRLLPLVLMVTSCAILPSAHRHRKELRTQVIPGGLLNNEWVLESHNGKTNACHISIFFLEQGKFRFRVDSKTFDGKRIEYLFNNSSVEFHTRPIDKIVWGDYNCELQPDDFARELLASFNWTLKDDYLFLDSRDSKFIFKKR